MLFNQGAQLPYQTFTSEISDLFQTSFDIKIRPFSDFCEPKIRLFTIFVKLCEKALF